MMPQGGVRRKKRKGFTKECKLEASRCWRKGITRDGAGYVHRGLSTVLANVKGSIDLTPMIFHTTTKACAASELLKFLLKPNSATEKGH